MSITVTKSNNTHEKVEEMGVNFEKRGLPPMAGRVLAFLLLAEPPYKDFYEIQEGLKASKSAISNALNYLQNLDNVTYITFSGDRKRYFGVNPKKWMSSVRKRIEEITDFAELLEDVLEQRQDSRHLDFNEGLQEIVDLHRIMADKISEIAIARNIIKAPRE
jgi:DNA-binding transcriptional regulator GbsR (MarR family)